MGPLAGIIPAITPYISAISGIATGAGAIRSLFGGRGDDRSLKTARQLLTRREAAKAPVRAQGQELINKAIRGELTPAQKSQVDLEKARKLAAWRQHLATLGIPESSAALEGTRRIEEEASAFTNQLLQQTFDQGASLLNLSSEEAQSLFAGALANKQIAGERFGKFGKSFGDLLAAMKGLPQPEQESVSEEVSRRAGGITYPTD